MPRKTIIVEGPSDEAFVKALMKARGLGPVTVTHTGTLADKYGGNSKFGAKLRSLKLEERGSKTRHFLLISDSDNNHDAAFSFVREQISSVYPGCAPLTPRAASGTDPSFSVAIIPFDEPGCLETLCASAIKSTKRKLRSDLDLFASSLRYDEWRSEVRKAKFWVRCAVAALHEKDPSIYLRNVFSDPGIDRIIPLTNESFDGIASVIQAFCDLP